MTREFENVSKTSVESSVRGIICNAAAVNVRKRPSPHSKILGVLMSGDIVEILDILQTIEPDYPPRYYVIKYQDGKGFVSCKYCREVSDE